MGTQVTAGDINLSCAERGAGDPVVLVAGGYLEMEQWEPLVELLSVDHRVIWFDQRGVGASEKATTGYTIEQLAADTANLIEALEAWPCALFGSSLGGLVAIEVALRHGSQVRALILAATAAGARGAPTPRETQAAMFRGAAHALEEVVAALMEVLFASDYCGRHPEMAERAVAKRREQPGPAIATLGPLQSALRYDPLERLAGLETPTLVLHGSEDRLVPVGNARILSEAMPQATRIVVPGAGHAVVTEAAERVHEAVRAFLSSV